MIRSAIGHLSGRVELERIEGVSAAMYPNDPAITVLRVSFGSGKADICKR
jgi:hypothetical protein